MMAVALVRTGKNASRAEYAAPFAEPMQPSSKVAMRLRFSSQNRWRGVGLTRASIPRGRRWPGNLACALPAGARLFGHSARGQQDQIDAAIVRAPFVGVIVVGWHVLGVARDCHAGSIDLEAIAEQGEHRDAAGRRQLPVVAEARVVNGS